VERNHSQLEPFPQQIHHLDEPRVVKIELVAAVKVNFSV
jgi:hypothetical protein